MSSENGAFKETYRNINAYSFTVNSFHYLEKNKLKYYCFKKWDTN